MRRFASDVLIARDIVLTFRSPASDLDWPLSAEVRREVLLIFKEAVNNVARHSGATAATIELAAAHGDLNVKVSDNGRGFDRRPTLREMALRACGDGQSASAERSACAQPPAAPA